jgi:hypothetical protein
MQNHTDRTLTIIADGKPVAALSAGAFGFAAFPRFTR